MTDNTYGASADAGAARRNFLLNKPDRSQAEEEELVSLDPDVLPGMDREDRRTHVERINPGLDPAAVPWAAGAYPAPPQPPLDRGPQRLYTMLAKGTHNSVMYRAGSTVMLYDDEVAAHHKLVGEPYPILPPILPPTTGVVMDPRDAEIERMKNAFAAKDEALSRLARENADMNRLRDEVAAKDREIADLNSRLETATATIASQEQAPASPPPVSE